MQVVTLARDLQAPQTSERDGTSQAGRGQPALDPSYVSADERSPLDLLEFARKYAGELVFHDEQGRPAGDWGAFLEQDLAELAALVDEAQAPTGAAARRVDRPHLALFLAFLRLLRHPRDLVNTLTRRHLEFYYEQLLRMSRKAAVPDRVHVLPRLAAGVERARLPEGTLLRAGKDELGRERLYRTDRELVVSRASVARLSSVYAQKELVGLREARELYNGPREEAVLRMLAIALGEPRPGDALPPYGGRTVTHALLRELKERIDFADARLFMTFPDLHTLMQLQRRRAAADAEWRDINQFLEKAGRTRLNTPGWRLDPDAPRDFTRNLNKAIGGALDFAHEGLPGVNSIDDLYEQRVKADVRAFIEQKLFLSVDDFAEMMRIKIRIDSEWREINRILTQAGRRKRDNPSYEIAPSIPLTDFAARLQAAAVDPLPFDTLAHAVLPAVTDVEAYYDAILELEAYFHLNAVQAGYVLSTAEKWVKSGEEAGREWNNVYRLLSTAHEEKVYAGRRQVLRSAREGAPDPVSGFRAMLRIALGKDAGEPRVPSLLEELGPLVSSRDDSTFLEGVQARLASGSITPEEWARVYQVVELAQRVREKLPQPVAQRETWLQLHAAEDATSVVAGPAAEPGSKPRRWKTFGQKPPEATPDKPPPGLMGWAIASPTLLLTQGRRTIVLTLGFQARHFDAARLSPLFDPASPGTGALEVEVSTEKGWLACAARVSLGDYPASRALTEPLRALQLTLTLDETAAATASPGREASGLSVPWPMLRLTLRPIWDAQRGQYISHYGPFRDLTLAAVHLRTSVEGLVPSAVQNDEAVLRSKSPFAPFGTNPAVGSRFYVGDPELVLKRLERLVFHVEWRAGPSDLVRHYANYPDAGPFTTRISLVDNHVRLPLTDPPANLFAGADATKPRDIEIKNLPALVEKPGTAYRYEPRVDLPAGPQVSAWPRHFEWELTPNDFKHSIYPTLAAQKALELTAAMLRAPGTGIDAANYQVKPPYTPWMRTFLVSYTASTEVVLAAASKGPVADRLFHVHPFGVSPLEAETGASGARFLPRYDHEGELYIGLRNAKPPETVSLLFQMAESSADPELLPVPIEWSYLSGDRWLTLHDGHLLLDTTRHLMDSGIVQIALEPAQPSTRLPGELYWLRAAIPYGAGSVCDTVGIHAQAVSATFVDGGGSSEHLARKLPERSITGLQQRLASIVAVEQPYPSYGGRPAEEQSRFYTRVSERLRHKQRALTLWDYERLVLERFPEVYKVKGLPANADTPGTVELIVIPGARGQLLSNPFEPKAPAALNAEIEAYLADKRPPQATLRVRNAHFVQVKVRVGVRFRGEGDEGFYKTLLNEELNRYLSPWAYDESADITIGGKLFANSIVSFIDGRDYVDYVAPIKLYSSEDGRTFKPAEGDFVATGRPDGVLVGARQHEIDVISEAGFTAESFTGINHMKLELDFIVAGSK
jgi:baseplate J-like protein